ncbi:MAG: hypothetical protein IJ933_06910, partial [Bacteroidales bacterium]|nr:hypothetical protein [Bacteroidales bacterium]
RSNMTEAERNIYLRHIEAMRNEKSATDYSYASGKVDGRAEGLAEGLAEGEKKGEHQKALSIARAMKQHGDDIDYIAAITGLTPDEIAAL